MKLNKKQKQILIRKLEDAIKAPDHLSCKSKIRESIEEIKNATNERQVLIALSKLIELMGILAKAYFGSS